jgi:MoaA/NifB/PqqE/SkfB family radical SAM enzyme
MNRNSKEYQPRRFRFEVTAQCSMSCRHCYLGKQASAQLDMTLAEAKQTIDAITRMLPVDILLLGGEPFERNDILEIIEYAVRKRASVSIDTNAYSLTAQAIKRLKEIGVKSLNITIYGCTQSANDKFTCQGHFHRIIEALECARQENLRIDLALLVTRQNYNEIFKIGRFADRYNAQKVHVDVFLGDRQFEHRKAYQLSTWQFIMFWASIRIWLRITATQKRKQKHSNLDVSFCDQRSFPLIKPDGSFWPCLFYGQSIGNVLQGPPEDLWKQYAHYTYDKDICARCISKKLDNLGQYAMLSSRTLSMIFLALHSLYNRALACMPNTKSYTGR